MKCNSESKFSSWLPLLLGGSSAVLVHTRRWLMSLVVPDLLCWLVCRNRSWALTISANLFTACFVPRGVSSLCREIREHFPSLYFPAWVHRAWDIAAHCECQIGKQKQWFGVLLNILKVNYLYHFSVLASEQNKDFSSYIYIYKIKNPTACILNIHTFSYSYIKKIKTLHVVTEFAIKNSLLKWCVKKNLKWNMHYITKQKLVVCSSTVKCIEGSTAYTSRGRKSWDYALRQDTSSLVVVFMVPKLLHVLVQVREDINMTCNTLCPLATSPLDPPRTDLSAAQGMWSFQNAAKSTRCLKKALYFIWIRLPVSLHCKGRYSVDREFKLKFPIT